MRTLTRWEPFRGATSLQDQINRVFKDVLERTGEESSLTAWAPAVDIYETEHELVVKAGFTLANTVNAEAIKADYQNGVLTLTIPKREEAKPKQIKINVGTQAMAAAAAK